ncbi:TIR domain-containing protein [Candidatus Endomicrobiellum agilis]|uniref:TIR domain-containing protein n=1 Tax=Candidatus Endomicrobiellum agilis TaxID=3238957 RepID=UPI003583B123|nr:TIR domain-containing protein [Endomicrobium sp.]
MSTKRRVFYSFHYEKDAMRTAEIRNIGALEKNTPVSDNEWEQIKAGGDHAIKRWIDDSMKNCSCIVVLVGEETANRKWVQYEIRKAWSDGKGVVGIYIHNIKCPRSGFSQKGNNPFDFILNGTRLSSIVECFEPYPADAYNDIAKNLKRLVEDAIKKKTDISHAVI